VADDQNQISAVKENNGRLKANASRLLWPGALAFAALLYFGLVYFNDALTHEATDDAFIEGHIVSVAPKIAGHVANVFVHDNQFVKKGEPLVEIDTRDYQIQLDKRQASVQTYNANLKAILSVLELMGAKVTTAEAAARQAHAQEDASRAANTDAQATFQRAQELLKTRTISQQEFDDAQAAAKSAAANLKSAEENSTVTDSRVNEAKTTFSATQAGVDWVRAQVNEADIGVSGAELDLSYTKIFAPGDGRVSRKAVEPGNYVQVGQALMALVQPEAWVVANFKETQLAHVRTNQPVEIEIDSLPGRQFRGHVDSVQAGSGARFSLLPPENAIGNFVKVVQRVPVKILFDEPLPAEQVVGPGMSVYPSVEVKKEFLPRWALVLAALVIAFIFALLIKAAAKSQAQ